MSPPGRLFFLSVVPALAALLAPVPLWARPSPARIAVSTPGPAGPLARRLHAELWVLSIPAALLIHRPGQVPRSIPGYTAVVTVERVGGDVTVTFSGRDTVQVRLGGRAPGNVAYQVVELIRSRYLRRQAPPPPVTEHLPAGREDEPGLARGAGPRQHQRLRVRLHGAMLWSPGGLSPAFAVGAGVDWAATSRLSLGVVALAPMAPATIEEVEGAADMFPWFVGARAQLSFLEASSRVRLLAACSLGALMMEMRGAARPPYRSDAEWVTTFMARFSGGVLVRLAPRICLYTTAMVGITAPRLLVSFADRIVADWGRPLLGGAVGLEVGFL